MSGDVVPFDEGFLVALGVEAGVGANSEAIREAGIEAFVGCEAILSADGLVEARGSYYERGAAPLRCVVYDETRQVYFRAELWSLEGTPLCPCLIPTVPRTH